MNSEPEMSLKTPPLAERARDENKTHWLRHCCHQGSHLRRDRGASVGPRALWWLELFFVYISKCCGRVMTASRGLAALLETGLFNINLIESHHTCSVASEGKCYIDTIALCLLFG